jgi:hypothetical protein
MTTTLATLTARSAAFTQSLDAATSAVATLDAGPDAALARLRSAVAAQTDRLGSIAREAQQLLDNLAVAQQAAQDALDRITGKEPTTSTPAAPSSNGVVAKPEAATSSATTPAAENRTSPDSLASRPADDHAPPVVATPDASDEDFLVSLGEPYPSVPVVKDEQAEEVVASIAANGPVMAPSGEDATPQLPFPAPTQPQDATQGDSHPSGQKATPKRRGRKQV